MEEVLTPCKLILHGWSHIVCIFESNGACNYIVQKDEELKYLPEVNLILDFKQQDNKTCIYAMCEDDTYLQLEFYDTITNFISVNMEDRKNVFKSLNEINTVNMPNIYVANIPYVDNLCSLLHSIKQSLHFPSHILCKWESLPNLLRHPFWLGKWEHVVLVHTSIAALKGDELRAYKRVIYTCKLQSLYTSFVFNDTDYDRVIDFSDVVTSV